MNAVATSPSPASFARRAHFSHSCAAPTPACRNRGRSFPTAAHTHARPAAARARLGPVVAKSARPVAIAESALFPPGELGKSWCSAETMHSSTHAAQDEGPAPLSPPLTHASSTLTPATRLLLVTSEVFVSSAGANTGRRHATSASATSRDPACGNSDTNADTNAGLAPTLSSSKRNADARRFDSHASSPAATMATTPRAHAPAAAATSAADAADSTASTHAASSPSYPSRSGPAARSRDDRSNSAEASEQRHVSPGTTEAPDSTATPLRHPSATRRSAWFATGDATMCATARAVDGDTNPVATCGPTRSACVRSLHATDANATAASTSPISTMRPLAADELDPPQVSARPASVPDAGFLPVLPRPSRSDCGGVSGPASSHILRTASPKQQSTAPCPRCPGAQL